MIPKQSIITPEIIKQREDRHRRLMRMIKNFKRTNQQVNKLQRIKDNTVLEINLRFIRSQHNKNYSFPKDQADSDEGQKDINPFSSKSNQLYDLRAQNQIIKPKNQYTTGQILQSGRRVKSLDRQKNDLEGERLGRFEQTKGIYSYKKLRKKSTGEVKRILSTIKLPGLNKKQKIKTEGKNQSLEFEKVIGKKLLNEQSSPRKMQTVRRNSRELQTKIKIQNYYHKLK